MNELAQEEFGLDYDQLGPNEKEWVRDELAQQNNATVAYYYNI